MKSLAELAAIRARMIEQVNMRKDDNIDTRVVVGMATCGIAAGARPVMLEFVEELKRRGLENVTVAQTGCVGMCRLEPIVEVYVKGQEKVTYVHMTPEKVARFADDARANGFEVIIAAAGKAAHLAGVIAGHTTLPVIGIPIKSSLMDGLDSLLSTVQMPTGIPVATVAVGGGDNAAYLAAQMLSIKYPELREGLDAHRTQMAAAIEADDEALNAQL